VGDDNGVAVVPSAIASEVLTAVAQVVAREDQIRARILAGETTFEIFDLAHP